MSEKLKITEAISIDVGHSPSEVDSFFFCSVPFFSNFKVQGLLKKYDDELIKNMYQF